MSMTSCFFFKGTATTEIYSLSLHDALPISREGLSVANAGKLLWIMNKAGLVQSQRGASGGYTLARPDRKSTRLNSSHGYISYAVFCLKKKNDQLPTSQFYYVTARSITPPLL